MMFLTAFSLIISSIIAQSTTPPACQGCLVRGRQGGSYIWARPEEFLNETVYVEVDIETNTTQTLSRLLNTDAEASYWSLCTAALRSNQGVYATIPFTFTGFVYTPNCASGGTVSSTWEEYTSGTDGLLTTITESKICDIILETSTAVSSSGTTTCSTSATIISFTGKFEIPPEDHAWFTTSFNGLHSLTSNGQIPFSAYPSFGNCSRGNAPGIPVTKIPIHGIASTVISYKSRTQFTASSVPEPGGQPSPIVPPTSVPGNPQASNNPQTSNKPQNPHNPQPGVPAQSNQPLITSQPQSLPSGYSILPSGEGVRLPNGGTMKPGALTTIGGITVSLASDGSNLIVGTSYFSLVPTSLELPPGYSIVSSGEGMRLPNGDTLRPGMRTTVNSVPISVAPNGDEIIIASRTISMNETPGSGGVGERPTNGASTSATRMLTWACLFIVGLFYT